MAFNFMRFFSLRRSKGRQIDGPRTGFYTGGPWVNEDSAMKVAAFHRGVTFISTQVAKIPWHIKQKDWSVVENGTTKILNLSANPEMNAFMFRLFMVQTAIIHGNSYAEIERNNMGQPIALWPLNTRDVDIVRDVNGDMWYRVAGGSVMGDPVYLRPRDMFHVRNFHTKDGIYGQGLAAYASETLGISINADRMASGIFANGGIPSGVISVTGKLSPDAAKRLSESWSEQFGGRKTGGTAVLEQDAKFTPIEVDTEVLQFLDSRKFGVIEVARFLGLPPTKLFDTGSQTFNNIENANLEVTTDTIQSWLRNLEFEADVKLLNNGYGGLFTDFDIYEISRGDMTTRSNYFNKMMQSGSMSPNEIREREGLPPYTEGDTKYIAVNNFTPADMVREVVQSQIDSKKASGQPKPSEETESESQLNNAAVRFLLETK